MTNLHNLQLSIYNIRDIKYISDGSRLEASTVANGIEPALVESSTGYTIILETI